MGMGTGSRGGSAWVPAFASVIVVASSVFLSGCGDEGSSLCDGVEGSCVAVESAQALQDAVNTISGDTTLVLGAGPSSSTTRSRSARTA